MKNLIATIWLWRLKLLASEDVASAKSTRSGEPCETSLRANVVPIFGRRRRRCRRLCRRRRRCRRHRRRRCRRHDEDDFRRRNKRLYVAVLFDLALANYSGWTKSLVEWADSLPETWRVKNNDSKTRLLIRNNIIAKRCFLLKNQKMWMQRYTFSFMTFYRILSFV